MRVTATPEGVYVEVMYRGGRSRMYATGPAPVLFMLMDVICTLGNGDDDA